MTNQEQLEAILRDLEILSPAAILFRGEMIPVNPATAASVPGVPSHPLPGQPLIRELQALLYARCYTRRFDQPPAPPPTTSDPQFVFALAARNRSRPGWEGGWMIYQAAPNGQVWVVKGDRQRTAIPGEYVTTGPPGVPPGVGSIVNLQVPRDSMVAQPGFYYMYSEYLPDVWDDQSLVRFYFHTGAAHAAELIDELTSRLNRYQVPFRMKALNEPALYGRADAVVLYVARRHFTITAQIVRELPSAVRDSLEPATPLFTIALAPGVGVAEDPGTGESFGMHRCRLVAEGVVEAWQRGDRSLAGRLRAIASCFEKNGLHLHSPHIGADMVDLPSQLPEKVEFEYA